jgi:hypothetical protein
LRRFLTQSSAPYLVTILMAVVGWATLRAVDAVESASVEYCIRVQNGIKEVTIENLSTSKRFNDLRFMFALPNEADGIITEVNVEAGEPAFEGSTDGGKVQAGDRSAEMLIPVLQPGARFVIQVKFSGAVEPDFRLTDTADTFELLPCSTFTRIAKHELWFVMGMAFVSLILILILLWLSRPSETTPLEAFEDD